MKDTSLCDNGTTATHVTVASFQSMSSWSFVELWLSTVLLLAATLLGLCSNLLALVLTCCWGARSRFHTVFIGNLAVTDLLTSMTAAAHWLVLAGLLPPINLTSVVLTAFSQTLQAASAAAVVSITLDRLCLACRPIRYHLREGSTGACGLVLLLWLVSCLTHAPLLLVHPSTRRLLTVLFSLAECVVPLTILAISNCAIYRHIFRDRQLRSLRRHSGLPRPPPEFSMDGTGTTSCRGGERDSLRHQAFFGAVNARLASVDGHKLSLPCIALQNTGGTNSTVGTASSSAGASSSQSSSFRRFSAVSLLSRQRDSEELLKELLQRQHKRALRTLVCIVVLFAVCRLPYGFAQLVCWLVSRSAGGCYACDETRLQTYTSLLPLFNAALDPLVYALWGNQLYQEKLLGAWDSAVAFVEQLNCCGLSETSKAFTQTSKAAEDLKFESSPLVPVWWSHSDTWHEVLFLCDSTK